MNKEITNIDLVEGGNVVKQGDYFTIGYRPRNAKGEAVDLVGKSIAVEIFSKDGIAYESTGEFDPGVGLIYVHVNKNIGYGNMFIEFTVTDPNDASYRLKFPTNNNAGRLTIHRSTDDLEYVGVKMVTVEQLKADQRTFEQTVDGKVETLQQRVETGIGAFTSSTEILDARGGEVNLRARLDKTTAQLAETAKKTEVQSLVTNKADITYVDTKLANIGDAKPSGVYTTLAALQSAFPTGNGKNIYLVTTDGKWYFWNGSAWTAGGVYQSTGIADGAISKSKLSSDLSVKLDEIDVMKYDVFLPQNDNVNFDLSVIDNNHWYVPESSFIEPVTHPYLVAMGVKNWIHLDVDEYNNFSGGLGFRDVHYKLKYPTSISGKYFQIIFFLHSETGTISDFNLGQTFISTGTGFSVVQTTEVNTELVPGYTNLWKVRKSGLIPTGGFKEIWIGAPFNSYSSVKRPDINIGGFYGKVFDSNPLGKDAFTTKLPKISPHIKKNTDEINALNSGINTLSQEFELLKNSFTGEGVSKWNGTNLVMLGDSIVWYDGRNYPNGTKAIGYPTLLNQEIGFNTVVNSGVSGACIAEANTPYVDVYTTAETINYTNADLVIIAAGTNDYDFDIPLGTLGTSSDTAFDQNTYYGAYRRILNYILTKKPTIQIVLMTPLKRANFDVSNAVGLKLSAYAQATKEVADLYSIPVIDMYGVSGINKMNLSTYTIDNLHLNNLGYERVTNNVITPFLETI